MPDEVNVDSLVLRKGMIFESPTSPTGIPNKQYVDDKVAGAQTQKLDMYFSAHGDCWGSAHGNQFCTSVNVHILPGRDLSGEFLRVSAPVGADGNLMPTITFHAIGFYSGSFRNVELSCYFSEGDGAFMFSCDYIQEGTEFYINLCIPHRPLTA